MANILAMLYFEDEIITCRSSSYWYIRHHDLNNEMPSRIPLSLLFWAANIAFLSWHVLWKLYAIISENITLDARVPPPYLSFQLQFPY